MDDGSWVAPWTAGLAQANCVTCRSLVVARTLDEIGECANCSAKTWEWERQQLALEVARPVLFDQGAGATPATG